MAHAFGKVPDSAAAKPEQFILHVSDQEIGDFKSLLELSKIGPETWYNKQEDRRFGLTRKWLAETKEAWLKFDWRKQEERINSFPNFKVSVNDPDCGPISVHFTALFSANRDALPVIFMHGWPGSFLEFLPMVDILVKKYTPETLPYHVVVPSLPGFGFSSIPLDVELTIEHAARIMNQLMVDLGFGAGYVAQGGDVGSYLSRMMSAAFKECKAIHLNLLLPGPEDAGSTELVSTVEVEHMQRARNFHNTGMSYALVHGLQPATIGLVLSSNPIALLAWIGEKLMAWVDTRQPLALDTIMLMVSLYWYTSTFPRGLYPYRVVAHHAVEGLAMAVPTSKEKPLGYSVFPAEIGVMPRAWAERVYPNLALYASHQKGGHFAALEEPEIFLQDVEEFLTKVRAIVKA